MHCTGLAHGMGSASMAATSGLRDGSLLTWTVGQRFRPKRHRRRRRAGPFRQTSPPAPTTAISRHALGQSFIPRALAPRDGGECPVASPPDAAGRPVAVALCGVVAAAVLSAWPAACATEEASQAHVLSLDRGAVETMIERKFAKKLHALPDDDLLQMMIRMLDLEDDRLSIDMRSLLDGNSQMQITSAPPVKGSGSALASALIQKVPSSGAAEQQAGKKPSTLQLQWEAPALDDTKLPLEAEVAPDESLGQPRLPGEIFGGSSRGADEAVTDTAPPAEGSDPAQSTFQAELRGSIAAGIQSGLTKAAAVAGEVVEWANANVDLSALPVPPSRVREVTAKAAGPVLAAVLVAPWLARSVAARFGSEDGATESAQAEESKLPVAPAPPTPPTPAAGGAQATESLATTSTENTGPSSVLWVKTEEPPASPAELSASGGILWSREDDPWFSDKAAAPLPSTEGQSESTVLWKRESSQPAEEAKVESAREAEARRSRGARGTHRSTVPREADNGTSLLDNVEI